MEIPGAAATLRSFWHRLNPLSWWPGPAKLLRYSLAARDPAAANSEPGRRLFSVLRIDGGTSFPHRDAGQRLTA
jgi:hypothetical protein